MKLRDPEETDRPGKSKATVGEYLAAMREANAAWQRVDATVKALKAAYAEGQTAYAANVRYSVGAALSALDKHMEALRVLADASDDIARAHAAGNVEGK